MTDDEIREYDRIVASITDPELQNIAIRDMRLAYDDGVLMDRTIIDNTNAVVGEKDTLWHFGDFAFVHDMRAARVLRDRIKCQRIILIQGNHDNRSPEYRNLFERVYEQYLANINGQDIFMNHYAMLAWNKSFHGSWLLYGHSHGRMTKFTDEHLPQARMLDVGVDTHDYKPWSFEQVKTFMDGKKGTKLG